jgi:hypothetical protein
MIMRPGSAENSPLFKAETATIVLAKQPDGKIRVTYAGWEDARVVLGRTGAGH